MTRTWHDQERTGLKIDLKPLTKPDQLSEYFAIGCFEKFLEVCFNQALGQAVVSFGERPNATNP